jgi:hypothetical protein
LATQNFRVKNGLEVGIGATILVAENNGNIGINSTTPTQKLDVAGTARIEGLIFGSGTEVTSVDADLNAVSASHDTLASAKAIKSYVDQQITAEDLDFSGDSGTGSVDLDSQSLSISGTANEIETSASGQTLTIGLPDEVSIASTLTVSSSTTINSSGIDISTNLTVDGLSDLDELNVAGLSTFSSNVDINAGLDVDGFTELDGVNVSETLSVSGLSTFSSNVDIDAGLDVDGFTELDGVNVSETLSVSGLSTFASNVDINAGLDVDGFTELDSTNISETLSVSGLSTFASNVDINAGLDVDGFTELDSTNISETLSVSGLSTFSSNVDINADLDVDGFTELDGVNVSETLSVSGLSTFSSNVDVNASVDISTDLTVDGLSDLDELNVAGLSTFGSNVDINASVDISTDLTVDGLSDLDELNVSGVSTFVGDVSFGSTVTFGDNDKIILGDGNDLEIFHSGSASVIRDTGTGNLFLQSNSAGIILQKGTGSENLARFLTDGAVELYYDNSKKFETVGTGVSISSGTASTATIYGPGNLIIDPAPVDDNGGIVRIKGDLYVDGTTTEINSTTLTIDDLNIVVASGATNSTAADGAGITVDGASATLQYATSGDKWVFNKAPYYNANRLLTTADEGSGNGIDSDTLDGQEGTYYLDYANFSGIATDSDKLDGQQGTYYLDYSNFSGIATDSDKLDGQQGTYYLDYANFSGIATDSDKLDGQQGTYYLDYSNFSGIATDSDKLDGQQGTYYLNTSGTSQTKTGDLIINGNLGLGTSPSQKLDVNGAVRLRGAVYDNNNSTGTSAKVLKSTGSGVEWGTLADLGGISGVTIADDNSSTSVFNIAFTDSSGSSITELDVSSSNLTYKPEGKLGIGTNNPSVTLDVNGDLTVSGIITATTFSGSGASLTSIPNSALDNSSVNFGGVTLSLGQSDTTPAFDLQDATNYPYTSLTGISTEILYDTTPQLGGNLDLNSNDITGTGDVNITGVITATTFSGSGASLTSIPNSALDNSSVNFGGVTLSLGQSDTTPAFDLSDATNYPYTSLTGISTEILYDTTPQLGGNLDLNSNDITGTGDVNITGVVTATSFVGPVTGTASSATQLENARNFSITGDFITASNVSFDGTSDVGLSATITTNSITLGTYTSGDYVESISGTANQITVTSGTGEGSTPIISIPNNPTLPGTTVTIENDLQINRNLNVIGNITIGGTTAFIDVDRLRISDADIILGYRTDSNNLDASTDSTASHGGVAVASTEGTPLVSLVGAGETLPSTYKKIMWFESGSFSGLGTDAWLINYGVGIGSTQVPYGVVLAAGDVHVTNSDIKKVRDINSSGIITATTFSGSGASLTSIPNSALDNSSVNFGGVTLSLGQSDTTPAFDLSDATNYPYTSLTGISTEILYDTTPQLGGNLDLNSKLINGTGGINISGIITGTTFSGSGASLTSIPNSALDNSSVNFGGVTLSLGQSDTTPAFDLQDATNYPYTSLTGISTNILGDTTPQLGGNLDLNSKLINGTGGINITGFVTATTFSVGDQSGPVNGKFTCGADKDFDIYHTGSNTYLDNKTGHLYIRTNASTDVGGNIYLRPRNAEEGIIIHDDGAVELYYDNSKKLETTNAGVTITGIATATTFSGSGASLTNIPNSALDNSSIAIGGVTFNLGDTDATPAFDLSDATNYPYTSLTGISTEILYDTTPQLGGNLDLNSKLINGTGGINITGVITATTFSGSGASLTSIPNNALDNSSIAIGGVTFNLGDTDATPAFDLSDATNYPYTSLTGISTEILYDTTPQLGGNLDLNSKLINGTGGINITGVVTATSFDGIVEVSTDTTPQLGGNLDLNSKLINGTGGITITGVTTSTDFNTTSDQNLKTNIRTIEDPLEKIVQIRGVNFEWKENNKPSAGVIAQEVEKVLPQLVNGNDTKTVNYNGLIGLLIETVKEQQKQIDNLNTRLSKLE